MYIMFIKIKLEPNSLKASPLLKKISYFSINEDATISNLKTKIEEYVDVPAERQEIRTLIEVFQNSYYVKDVCNDRGYTIMLYACDESNTLMEPKFVCFLQVYTNELAAKQQELENRSNLLIDNAAKTTPVSSTSSVTLIADSDTDSEGTDVETSSNDSKASYSDSAGTSDNSNATCRKRHCKLQKNYTLQNKKLKVTDASKIRYSETLCHYLHEFPNCPKNENLTNPNDPIFKAQALEESLNKESTSNDGDRILENTNSRTNFETQSSNANSTKIQSNMDTLAVNNKQNNNNTHPCYSISPEIRDFLAIVCHNDLKTITNVECQELLVWFFDRFRECNASSNLEFDNKNAISVFDGKLWIACMNMNTFQWISTNIIKYSLKSFKILALKDSKHLCEAVVPLVSNSKNILDVFDLLEKQNKNLITLKWSLRNRRPLLAADNDLKEKVISTFCTNELLTIEMDTESKQYLENLNFILKYCFWHIVFKFI